MDALAYLGGPAADLSFRRGWTHGIPALVALPFVLTGAMLLLDQAVRRWRRASLPSGVVPREVLRLAVIAILTHPILDTLNVYGVRWLMPFRDRWFYGDTLFIVDPWLWLVLGAGVILSRPSGSSAGRDRSRAARVALGTASVYVAGMLALGIASRRIARRELEDDGLKVERLMVAPQLLTPFVRRVVVAQGHIYQVATFRWGARPHLDPGSRRVFPRPQPDDHALAAARDTELGRRFLGWARFPMVQVAAAPSGGTHLYLIDLRYAERANAGFGSVTVEVSSPPSEFEGSSAASR